MDLNKFLEYCNSNPYGISFTHVVDNTSLVFLDLDLQIEEGSIISKTHFKPSAGNSYLHAKSHHHPKWIRNIPHGQFCRLKKTCTKKSDYEKQGSIVKKKFLEKGYEESLIKQAFYKYWTQYDEHPSVTMAMEANKTSGNKRTTDSNISNPIRFSTQYNTKAFDIQRAIEKNWNILKQDPILNPVLPPKPVVVFRKSKDLRSLIAPSRVRKPQNQTKTPTGNWASIFDQKGNYKCGTKNCGACAFMAHRKKEIMGSDGQYHKIKQFINCGTSYVVYGLICPCGLLYVGRTIRPLRTRFSEHKCSIINSNTYHQSKNKKCHSYSVPRHFRECHNSNPTGIKVFGIEAIKKDADNGRRFRRLCKQESFWIFTLGSLVPDGMNEDLHIHWAI